MLDYSRLKGDVDLERSWLYVDGRRRPARVTWTAFTPVSFAVIFAWRWPCRPGTHTLRAHLGTTGGGSVSYEWTSPGAVTVRLAPASRASLGSPANRVGP